MSSGCTAHTTQISRQYPQYLTSCAGSPLSHTKLQLVTNDDIHCGDTLNTTYEPTTKIYFGEFYVQLRGPLQNLGPVYLTRPAPLGRIINKLHPSAFFTLFLNSDKLLPKSLTLTRLPPSSLTHNLVSSFLDMKQLLPHSQHNSSIQRRT